MKHKEDPRAVLELIEVPQIMLPDPEPVQLFNLADDPGEENDLAGTFPGHRLAPHPRARDLVRGGRGRQAVDRGSPP